MFINCVKLTNIEIPDSVVSIGDFAFFYCGQLTSLNIPKNVTSIGRYAFFLISALSNVTFESMTGWYVTENEGMLSGTDISVDDASVNAVNLVVTHGAKYWYKNQN